jgi:hypothetical protein
MQRSVAWRLQAWRALLRCLVAEGATPESLSWFASPDVAWGSRVIAQAAG